MIKCKVLHLYIYIYNISKYHLEKKTKTVFVLYRKNIFGFIYKGLITF